MGFLMISVGTRTILDLWCVRLSNAICWPDFFKKNHQKWLNMTSVGCKQTNCPWQKECTHPCPNVNGPWEQKLTSPDTRSKIQPPRQKLKQQINKLNIFLNEYNLFQANVSFLYPMKYWLWKGNINLKWIKLFKCQPYRSNTLEHSTVADELFQCV